jgi:hypothetical protein
MWDGFLEIDTVLLLLLLLVMVVLVSVVVVLVLILVFCSYFLLLYIIFFSISYIAIENHQMNDIFAFSEKIRRKNTVNIFVSESENQDIYNTFKIIIIKKNNIYNYF